ncbi:uncharacterized protein LOC124370981 isoform X1 [Homalodisca vitripennis]|uniref:uncharacterized protein LOC124370981 isoform X1 n=1 Tax=Homalodisca vitripennis TaxID=197043 RepID=UPI001EEAD754|nr:uncharacterized protein LOC124370981 isoform X1 [Homalodisca vitripennis]
MDQCVSCCDIVNETRTTTMCSTPRRGVNNSEFGASSSPGHHSETPLGPLALFSFVSATRTDKVPDREQREQLWHTLQSHFNTGIYLDTKEKGVLFPVIHFTDDRDSLKKRLSDEHALDNDYVLHQGVYREVRSIRPEGVVQNGHASNPKSTAYIVIGFKGMDKNFSQEVMVDSWKDWTGARHIYMYLPDEMGLSKISFYHREAPHSLNMFLYVVLVECCNVSNVERQVTLGTKMRLLDFTQRLRAERMTGYISVYGVTPAD